MSINPEDAGGDSWSLDGYVRALVAALATAEPGSAARLRRIVGDRAARIAVDEEVILVRFTGEELRATPLPPGASPSVAGIGETDRQTVLELLAGRIEVTEAVVGGRLRLRGSTDAIVRMSLAIEILIDVAVRAPRLQELARFYRQDPARAPLGPGRLPDPSVRRTMLHQKELAMLRRLRLLPDADKTG